jgi:RHS repeat-associated protein
VLLYDGWNLIAELDAGSSNDRVRTYIWGTDLSGSLQGAGGVGGLIGVSDFRGSTTHHFAAHDGNGNVAAIVDGGTGALTARYEYGPFGEPLRTFGTIAKNMPLRFSSKYTDNESGLDYYGYRYYSPSTGRWNSRDPISEKGGFNLLEFVGNSATYKFDPLGLEVHTFTHSIIGSTVFGHACSHCYFVITVSWDDGGPPYNNVKVEWTTKLGIGGCVADFQGSPNSHDYLNFGGSVIQYGNSNLGTDETSGPFPSDLIRNPPVPPSGGMWDPNPGESPASVTSNNSIPWFDFKFTQILTCLCGGESHVDQMVVDIHMPPGERHPPPANPGM